MRWRIAGLQLISASGIEPIPETKKRQTDESILETSRAGCDIRGRRNCWRECPWRNRHKQRKCRRILPPGRNRSHDRLRLRHDGAMQGGLCRHRRRLLPRSQAQHYRQCIQQPQQQPQCPRLPATRCTRAARSACAWRRRQYESIKGGRRGLIATGCQIVSLRGQSARAIFLASRSPVSLPIFAFRDCRGSHRRFASAPRPERLTCLKHWRF